MPYIFVDDGAPEASDYDSNYVFVEEEAFHKPPCPLHNALWRRVSGWWRACPAETTQRH